MRLLVLFLMVRNAAERAAFVREHPRPGPDYVVDHIIPLCACAGDAECVDRLDRRDNMQWQTYEESLAKDRLERVACAAIRRAIAARLVPSDPAQ